MPLLLFFSSTLNSAWSSKFQSFSFVAMFSPLPCVIRTPFSTVQPFVLPLVIPYHPDRSLPFRSAIGFPLTRVPSSCSSAISGARSPVMVQLFLAPLIDPSSLPLTYLNTYSTCRAAVGPLPRPLPSGEG